VLLFGCTSQILTRDCYHRAAVNALRSEDFNLLIKSQLIGAPLGYWIGEQHSSS
jgi:hypothetical protein